jgi:hypothetical protein
MTGLSDSGHSRPAATGQWLSHRGVPDFTLVTQRKNQHDILPLLIAIKRDISALAIGNQDLAQSFLAWAADQRVPLENLDPVANYIDSCSSGFRGFLG